jgi:hypothetical protein
MCVTGSRLHIACGKLFGAAMSDFTPEESSRIDASVQSVLDRLTNAGWAHPGLDMPLRWTPLGAAKTQQLAALLQELGGNLNAFELEALTHFLRYVPPNS